MAVNEEIRELLVQLYKYSPSTYHHSINVASIAVPFSLRMGFSGDELEKLRVACLLHDIGKLKIPKEILDKPSKLTDEEYSIMKNHAQYGAELLKEHGMNNQEILDLVSLHHERIDGKGYPKGLTGNEIPDLAKILTICDSFDAMNYPRLYHQNRHIDIIQELKQNKGTQFDPYYTEQFIEYIVENNLLKRHAIKHQVK